MATKIVIAALAALFGPDVVAAIEAAISDVVSATLRGAEKWEFIVKQYHDGKASDIDKKRSISAAFKVACNARGISDESAKVMFSSGTAKAEIALGYKVMPTAGTSSKKKAAPAVAPAAVVVAGDVASNLEVCAIAREIADRTAHFQTHEKLSKSATEAIGVIAKLVGELNVKLGNVPKV